MIKETLKVILRKVLPQFIFFKLKKYKKIYSSSKSLKAAYKYDLKRYKKYSDTLYTDTAQKLIGKIIREYHVLEKGLTMPEPRLGFGKELIITLSTACLEYIEKYGIDEPQLQHAIGVILEYENFHKEQSFNLDKDILHIIETIKQKNLNISRCHQRETTKDEYFKHTESAFVEFAQSRASIRNYSNDKIPLEKITKALEIAQTTPSQCNRQCWRTYIYTDKTKINEILLAQGGNRGFGHLADKLIVIAAEIGVFCFDGERNSAYIDGGMYAMNLLYALHYQKIAACILNCSTSPEKDIELRKLCGIKESEVFIAMISCGIPPEKFEIAVSKRYKIDRLINFFGHKG
jgi:nitroreductase